MNESPDDIASAGISSFIVASNLSYGARAREGPSWAICLNTYEVSASIAHALEYTLPIAISEFAVFAENIIKEALSENPGRFAEMLLFGVPAPVQTLWRKAIKSGRTIPFCFRPDLIITPDGEIYVVEFNVDTRLDRGIAEGVTQYSKRYVLPRSHRIIGSGLAKAYATLCNIQSPYRPRSIVTLLNTNWRPEYITQELFFSKAVFEGHNVPCHVFGIAEESLSPVVVGGINGNDWPVNGESGRITIPELDVLREPGTSSDAELYQLNHLMESSGLIAGCILPFSDKALLSFAFENDAACPTLHKLMCPSRLFDTSESYDVAGHGSPNSNNHVVLKGCGTFADTTASKGVVVSSDVTTALWRVAIDRASSDVDSGRRAWIVQDRLVPEKYPVKFRYTPGGKSRIARSYARISAYYVLDVTSTPHVGVSEPKYFLAAAIATAGTDEEALRRGLFTIRGLRQSTYMSVSTPLLSMEGDKP